MNTNWSTSGNWTTLPAFTTTSDIRFTGTTGLTSTADASDTVGDIIFGAPTGSVTTTGSFTLGGSPLSIEGQNAGVAEGGSAWGATYAIYNNGSGNQTINNQIDILGTSTIGTNTSAGSLTFGSSGGINIASGATLTVTQNAFSTSSFNGVISGSGALTLGSGNGAVTPSSLSATGNYSGEIAVSGANSFSGGVSISDVAVLVNGNSLSGQNGVFGTSTAIIDFASGTTTTEGVLIGGAYEVDNSFESATNGSLPLEFLGGTNTSGTAIFTGQFLSNNASGNGAAGLVVSAATGGTVEFTGAHSASGLIINHQGTSQSNWNAGTAGATDSLVKVGGGTVDMYGTSNYWGATIIRNGVLSVNTLANGGTFTSTGTGGNTLNLTSGTAGYSSIGTSSNAASNLVLAGGTLQYVGAAVSTDRLFTIDAAGGTLDASGTGAVDFTNTGSNVTADTSTTLTATTTSGSTTVNFANTNAGDLTNTNAGGNTTIGFSVGESITGAGIAAGTTITAINTGTSGVGTSITLSQAATATGTTTPTFGTVNRTLTLTGSNTGNNQISGVLGNSTGGATLGITKTGVGTWNLAGANTYTGATAVNVGKLEITGSLANTAVSVASGATLFGTGAIAGAVTVSGGGILLAGNGASATGGLTLSNGVNLSATSTVLEFDLGSGNTNSFLALSSGASNTFGSTQEIDLLNVQAGTYSNLITGLAGDPGSETNWTLVNDSGYAATFTYSNGDISVLVTAVPEPPASSLLLGGCLLALALKLRRQSSAT